MAGVALGDIHLRFAWQAWRLVTSTFVSRGRRGTWGTGLALVVRLGALWSPGAAPLCVAGVALGDNHLRFAWQAWHLGHWAGSGGARSGTWRLPPSFCVAGVALADIHLRFAWQVTSTFVLRGRRGTC